MCAWAAHSGTVYAVIMRAWSACCVIVCRGILIFFFNVSLTTLKVDRGGSGRVEQRLAEIYVLICSAFGGE